MFGGAVLSTPAAVPAAPMPSVMPMVSSMSTASATPMASTVADVIMASTVVSQTPSPFSTTPFPATLPTATPAGSCSGLKDGGASGAALAAALQFFITAQCLLNEPWPKQATLRNKTCFDFIVVGGGTAGSVLASRLAEQPKFNVLLIEAGPDPPRESIIPGFRSTLMEGPYDWNLTTVGETNGASQALIGASQAQPRGKMLGGTGSLNDMVYSRGFPIDYDEWAVKLGDDWSWNNVLPYFKKTEHVTDERIINDPDLMRFHGRSGPIEVAGFNASTFETDMFLNAFSETGFKKVQDMTNPFEIGVGRLSHTIKNGRRVSSATALLNEASKKDNLFVLKEAFVTKVLLENNTAYGVKVFYEGKELEFYARKEVIISAGTFFTPKLLMLSGIGPKDHLTHMGIKVIKDLPVGLNLHDHVMVLNHIAADNGTCYNDVATSHMSMIRYLYDQSGPLSIANTMAAYMALKNSTHSNVPDFAFYPTCLPKNTRFYESCVKVLRLKNEICLTLDDVLKEHELITIATVLLKPKSRGRVELKSTDPFDDPLIYSGTFSDMNDLRGYPEATDVIRKIVESSYFKRKNANIVNFNIEGCKHLEGEDKMKCTAKAMAMSAWHSVGTASMGEVVDSQLRVVGIQDLRVVDASVMPEVVRGNTNAPVIMIAEKAADLIKDEYKVCS